MVQYIINQFNSIRFKKLKAHSLSHVLIDRTTIYYRVSFSFLLFLFVTFHASYPVFVRLSVSPFILSRHPLSHPYSVVKRNNGTRHYTTRHTYYQLNKYCDSLHLVPHYLPLQFLVLHSII